MSRQARHQTVMEHTEEMDGDGGASGRSPYLRCEQEHDQRRHSEARDQ